MVICIDGHCFDVVVIDIWPPHRPGWDLSTTRR